MQSLGMAQLEIKAHNDAAEEEAESSKVVFFLFLFVAMKISPTTGSSYQEFDFV